MNDSIKPLKKFIPNKYGTQKNILKNIKNKFYPIIFIPSSGLKACPCSVILNVS